MGWAWSQTILEMRFQSFLGGGGIVEVSECRTLNGAPTAPKLGPDLTFGPGKGQDTAKKSFRGAPLSGQGMDKTRLMEQPQTLSGKSLGRSVVNRSWKWGVENIHRPVQTCWALPGVEGITMLACVL
jgi:hypothetical protein